MNSNKLMLNDSKTEFIILGNERVIKELPYTVLNLNDHEIVPSKEVKNLGVILDHHMTMSSFINALCKNMYFQLYKISTIRNILTEEVTKKLITTLVLSKLDYCNSLLAGLPNDKLQRLQLVQNNAARLVKRVKKYDHITPVLKDLHWLPVKQRIIYKICVICFKCLNEMAPYYLKLKRHTSRRQLRSSTDTTLLTTTHAKYKKYGERSFYFIGPHMWNALPKHIREAETLDIFKKRLKHHLFMSAFDS